MPVEALADVLAWSGGDFTDVRGRVVGVAHDCGTGADGQLLSLLSCQESMVRTPGPYLLHIRSTVLPVFESPLHVVVIVVLRWLDQGAVIHRIVPLFSVVLVCVVRSPDDDAAIRSGDQIAPSVLLLDAYYVGVGKERFCLLERQYGSRVLDKERCLQNIRAAALRCRRLSRTLLSSHGWRPGACGRYGCQVRHSSQM